VTTVLGLETSCDETAAAIVIDGRAVLANVIASQDDLHSKYGGVVPEIASRAHLERITAVIAEALAVAGLTFADLDAVAVGNRPGLIGSLLVGVSAAKAIAWSLGKPLIGVDHIVAHLYAASLMPTGQTNGNVDAPVPVYPALGLAVSGGHTSLFQLDSPLEVTLLGQTLDDAVGEAYDKAAVMLDAGYPGGPHLDRLAQRGDPTRHSLPRSLLARASLDFSYSGLKTALLYKVRGQPTGRAGRASFERSADDLTEQAKQDLAASFQAAAIDVLIIKLNRAIDALTAAGKPPRSLLIGGGVSANSLLRRRVLELGQERGLLTLVPPMAYCLDNAAMIAGLAYHRWRTGQFDDLDLPVLATTRK
jgi:N6-L-threonylcarbamoyladenine synthase